jgi:hypothetical protein
MKSSYALNARYMEVYGKHLDSDFALESPVALH